MDLYRWLSTRLFGTQWVLLFEKDGDVNISQVVFVGPYPTATIWYWNHSVTLLDNGEISGRSWFERWEPYTPFQRGQMPKPPEASQ